MDTNVTYHRWTITDYRSTMENLNGAQLISEKFSLNSHPSTYFVLFDNNVQGEKAYGLALKQFEDGQPIELNATFWLENNNGLKFCERTVQNQLFNNVGDQCQFDGVADNEKQILEDLWQNHSALHICCELTNLTGKEASLSIHQAFHQNHWASFEKEEHDTIVKAANGKEFKVYKVFFTSQSEIFAFMFKMDFMEGTTGIVEFKDISEETMRILIKWLYTAQIEDENFASNLLEIAEEYKIPLLKSACLRIMIKGLNDTNSFSCLTLAVTNNDEGLKKVALNCIAKLKQEDLIEFFTSQEWNELNLSNPEVAKQVSESIHEKVYN